MHPSPIFPDTLRLRRYLSEKIPTDFSGYQTIDFFIGQPFCEIAAGTPDHATIVGRCVGTRQPGRFSGRRVERGKV